MLHPESTPSVLGLPARLTLGARPVYPRAAILNHVQGKVVVEAQIDEHGNVSGVTPILGDPLLQPAAADAVKHYKYSPAMKDGKPVASSQRVTIAFVLDGQEPTPAATPTPTPRPGYVKAKTVTKIKPVCPQARLLLSSTYVVQVNIDRHGNVTSVEAISGNPTLAQPAIDAVNRWKFRPATQNGVPVSSSQKISVEFDVEW